ncbi:MAG TPA: TonB-dependent receptor [Thermoanaerobaculia bacterium]
MKYSIRLLVVALVCLSTVALFGQGSTSGTLSGIVTQDGVPLPGVSVTVASPNMQGTRTTVTNDAGGYTFGALPPGEYTVTFELAGLQTVTRRQRVGVAQSATVSAEMRMSGVAESITVTASAPAVAETTEVQSNFTGELIDSLPVGRTVIAVTNMAPGVSAGVNGLAISGGMSFDNLYTVNGAVIQENLRGQPHNLFIEDAIQETTVQTAGVSAEFGNFTGGVVNAITKSGGNEFSGSLRDSATNAAWTDKGKSFFTTTGVETQPTKAASKTNHTYEATLGGRIIRDRLWFFLAGREAETTSLNTFTNQGGTFTRVIEDKRREIKLTGAVTSRHNLIGSYLEAPVIQTPDCQIGCFDSSSLDPTRELPNDFTTLLYNGVLTNNFLVEARYSEKAFAFKGSGGEDPDRATGTPVRLLMPGHATVVNEPYFCGNCTPEDRNNKQYGIKGTYFLGTRALGNHNIVVGVDRWHETRLANNFQTPSGYVMILQALAPTRDANGMALLNIRGGAANNTDYLLNYFIPQVSEGSDLNTDAIYFNDKWTFNNWLFNIGLRYDKNDSADSAGNVIADDSAFSPRLGAAYDVFNNGRLRLNASYGSYVGRLAETIAGAGSAAGNNAWNGWFYRGPDIVNTPSEEAMRQVWAWFDSVGGTATQPVISTSFPGASRQIVGSIKSPSVDEFSVGASTQMGRGFLRADWIYRDWKDFYGESRSMAIGRVTLPTGSQADLSLVTNNNEFERTYNALELQGSYRLLDRLNLGANYTWSELKGNAINETSGSAVVTEITSEYYPEYYNMDWNNPKGFLPGDQTHKVRAWASYDIPTFLGDFTIGAIQRLDSGSPYSAIGTIDIRNSAALPNGVVNPGYVTPPTSVGYFFSERGQYRFEDLWATDLSVNYNTNPAWLRGVSLFAQAGVTNLFNQAARVSGNASTLTHVNCPNAVPTAAQAASGCPVGGLARFNPQAGDVPAEGVHWVKGAVFGQPTSQTTAVSAGSYQLPRTYNFSLGLRF